MAFGKVKNMMRRKASAQMDMLHGPLLGKILLFALPLAASSMLQQLFNSVDVAVVGRFASREALAAVGSNTPVLSLLINLFVGIAVGANVVVANYIGQGNQQGIRAAINTCTVIAIVSGLIMMTVGLCVARPILTLMGTPPEVLDQAVLYLRIFSLAAPFAVCYNFGAAILRSMGDTRRPLYVLVVAGILNTILNLFFVIRLQWGVAGVAVATAISNAVSACCVVQLLRHEVDPFRLKIRKMKVDTKELGKILRIGLPAGIQGMVFSFSNVFVQSAINSFGAAAIAGSAAAQNFEYYCYFLMSAFTGATVTFIGQNYGAGQKKRCIRVFWLCMTLAVVVTGAFNVLFTCTDTTMLRIFTTDADVIRFGSQRMQAALLWQFLACSYEVSGAALRGIGHSTLPALFTIFGTCVLRLVWIYTLFPSHPTFSYLLTCYPASWILTGLMVLTAWFVIAHRQLHARRKDI